MIKMYLKLENDMRLVVTVNDTIHRGDHLARKMIFLIPTEVGEITTKSAMVYMSYFRADGTADIDILHLEDEPYNDSYLQYTVPVTSVMTRYAGPVTLFLTFYSGESTAPVIVKSGECTLYVQASTNMDEYISDRNLSLVYRMHKEITDQIAGKADNLSYDEENRQLQLVSGEENVGDAVTVPADDYVGASVDEVTDAVVDKLSEDGTTIDGGTSEEEITYFDGGSSSGI